MHVLNIQRISEELIYTNSGHRDYLVINDSIIADLKQTFLNLAISISFIKDKPLH